MKKVFAVLACVLALVPVLVLSVSAWSESGKNPYEEGSMGNVVYVPIFGHEHDRVCVWSDCWEKVEPLFTAEGCLPISFMLVSRRTELAEDPYAPIGYDYWRSAFVGDMNVEYVMFEADNARVVCYDHDKFRYDSFGYGHVKFTVEWVRNDDGGYLFSDGSFCGSAIVFRIYYDKITSQGETVQRYREYAFTEIGFCYGYDIGYLRGTNDVAQDWEAYATEMYYKGQTEALNIKDTFKDAVFAIFDAPGQLLDGMLGFEIFGINFASTVNVLITLLVTGTIIAVLIKFLI